jgi:uncharacterized membrane protein
MKISSRSIASFGVLLLVCSAAACGGDDDAAAAPTPTGSTCDETLTYANFGQNFINTYCIRCHISIATGATRNDAPLGTDFDTLDMIEDWRDEIDAQSAAGPSVVNTFMPEADDPPHPTEDERRRLGAWLACNPLR